ncbi:class I SAM-dependent DNA methyltransferase [Thiothrix subterranea]|uniref:class I SAM-dependent DNA methyltransferase n=1 Tax=Thiothrix subterranea TaxID=2735563 RepID=UPI00192BE454|nr:DNA methyltransferase [Thiothrix subterranea]QQZ30748.1 class I SAM-dependent DNA methyltransferase [Thiothrix subterranea]
MNIDTLEQNLRKLVTNPDPNQFLYELLLVYEQPRASITRLQKGDYNLAKRGTDVLWKKKVYFSHERHLDLHALIDAIQQDTAITRHAPRFLIVTTMQHLVAVDTKTQDTLDIELVDLPKHFDFFLPWAGMEKQQFQSENPADVKAAERMGRLYDLIHVDNKGFDRHALNLFLSRLLFCFFAEDTGIFGDNQFTNAVGSHTADDGSDLSNYLQKLFRVLALRERGDFPAFLQAFPYVNGGLFEKDYPVPQFSRKSRKLILECGALNWKAINPDIFGSMIQAVVHDEQRSHLGMHYTSVVNIMKVIEPLFLNELAEELGKAAGNEGKLVKLLDRLYHLRIFDPACGSGNFLIIAYKELCKLEIAIFRELQALNTKWKTAKSGIRLTQFYGIELDDFAHETAKLSLWLAEHQMNMAFREVFGDAKPTLPLQSGGNIVCGNATRLNWETVCPKDPAHETYILGNPPYKGTRKQSDLQKEDMSIAFKGSSNYKNLDYIACWFFLGAKYIKNTNYQMAFVSTNSINQGQQVDILWTPIIAMNLEIGFAYQSFKWINNAKGNAGVTCVIIGIRNKIKKPKRLFKNNAMAIANNINAYLVDGKDISVKARKLPVKSIPIMLAGNYTEHAQNLMMNDDEKDSLIKRNPEAAGFVKKLIGSDELIKGLSKWCLWISNEDRAFAESLPDLKKRIIAVKKARENSADKEMAKLIERPHQFRDINETKTQSIVLPTVSSERREYLPIIFIDNSTVVTNKAMVLYESEPYIFSFLSSRMHMVWVRTVGGRMREDISYSSVLCYNTFPFPDISAKQKEKLEDHVFRVLDEREKHPEKTMAQLYDPDKMPEALRQAHHDMDIAIEQCYRAKPFTTDEERLEYLFTLYEAMIAKEKARG